MKRENDIWVDLRRLTAARIGLRRAGAALATGEMLDFQLAHARARDAVHAPLDESKLAADLSGLGLPVISLASVAADRQTYLMRPDLGRRLNAAADAALTPHRGDYEVAFVIADGLSARAVERHAAPVLSRAVPVLRAEGFKIAPLVIIRHGRVAAGDAVATALAARCVVVLIGERPGLSAPDSMGAYLTWRPNGQTTDAGRNCISNIRPEGVDYDTAAFKLTHLLRAMRARKLSGVALKDDSDQVSDRLLRS
ncbi:MAG: ethanolamine ammonia-lyase subunit EutC [Xanthobacteraceae bacterium]